MKLRRARRRQSSESIIALIDVVFFLLVFFMLIGRMDATAPFEVLPATANTGSNLPSGGATLSIAATGELALNGASIDDRALLPNITNLLSETPDLQIRINAHRDAQLSLILPLVAQIENAGAQDVVLIVSPEGT